MYQVNEKSTVHGLGTPHGQNTPHRMPSKYGLNYTEIFSNLTRQLYPTGRVWWLKKNSIFDRLHQAINRSFIRVIRDAKLTVDSTFPDNDNFTIQDCELWEYRLGLISNSSLSVEVRRQAILRKIAYPLGVKARQHPLFIENQLRLAGFDVYVHENTKPYKTPADVIALSIGNTQHGGVTQHGLGTVHGSLGFEVIANLDTPNESFSVGSNIWATFFIGGENLGDVATVPFSRLQEFKELVLKLKPAHTVVYTFLNYI